MFARLKSLLPHCALPGIAAAVGRLIAGGVSERESRNLVQQSTKEFIFDMIWCQHL
jgi:hypothetical protein